MFGDVSQPQGIGSISHEVAILQVVVCGHVGESASDSFTLRKSVDLEVAHDSRHELLVDDEPVFHPESCLDAKPVVGASRVGVHFANHVTQEQTTDCLIARNAMLVVVVRRALQANDPTRSAVGVTQAAQGLSNQEPLFGLIGTSP